MKYQNTRVVHPQTMRFWVNNTLDFACGLLWPGQKFSLLEMRCARKGIEEYYNQIPPEDFAGQIENEFSIMCLRISFLSLSSSHILPPSELFSPSHPGNIVYKKRNIFTTFGPVYYSLN
ncbi:MAG TPA: hypothetical protein VD905_19600 [Flavobacteriales bacterium]|nr:hypothetical protein [Flavobacteriales bacterium]